MAKAIFLKLNLTMPIPCTKTKQAPQNSQSEAQTAARHRKPHGEAPTLVPVPHWSPLHALSLCPANSCSLPSTGVLTRPYVLLHLHLTGLLRPVSSEAQLTPQPCPGGSPLYRTSKHTSTAASTLAEHYSAGVQSTIPKLRRLRSDMQTWGLSQVL